MSFGSGHYSWLIGTVVIALVAFLLYRRGRRLIGHQRLMEGRLKRRVVLFFVVIGLLLAAYARHPSSGIAYAAAAAGFAAGLVVALIALRYTQMGRDERGIWYVPNLYLGIGLVALLVARFVYEYFVLLPQFKKQVAAAAAHGAHGAPIVFQPEPVFHGVLFLVLGYYLVYYLGILIRAHRDRHLLTPGPEDGGTPNG